MGRASISANGTGHLNICDIINAEGYIQGFGATYGTMMTCFQAKSFLFQQDNAKPHSGRQHGSLVRVWVRNYPVFTSDLSSTGKI